MAGAMQYLIMAPMADIAGILADTGYNVDIPLYTEADPTPRTQTHARCAAPFDSVQEASIETPVTGARDVYPNSLFEQYNRVTQRGVPAQRLIDWGLTTSPT